MAETITQLSDEDFAAAQQLLKKLAENADAIEEALEILSHLSSSGLLAGLNGMLEDADENISATIRPDFMRMMANLMMLLGIVSQLNYEMLFDMAMKVPQALNDGYPHFKSRTEPMGAREAASLVRSPEMASALHLVVGMMKAMKGPIPPAEPAV